MTTTEEIVQYTETHHCPRCNGAITGTCVRGRQTTDEKSGRTIRVIQVYCGHCNAMFQAPYGLRGDELVRVGPVMLVMGPDLREMKNQIAALHGDVGVPPEVMPPDPCDAEAAAAELARITSRRERRQVNIEQVRQLETSMLADDVKDLGRAAVLKAVINGTPLSFDLAAHPQADRRLADAETAVELMAGQRGLGAEDDRAESAERRVPPFTGNLETFRQFAQPVVDGEEIDATTPAFQHAAEIEAATPITCGQAHPDDATLRQAEEQAAAGNQPERTIDRSTDQTLPEQPEIPDSFYETDR